MVGNGKTWRLRHWISLGYAIPIIALCVSTIATISYLQKVKIKADSLARSSEIQDRVSRVYANAQIVSKLARGYLLSRDSQLLAQMRQLRQQYQAELRQIEQLIDRQDRQQSLEQIEQLIDELRQSNNRLIELAQAGKVDEAIARWQQGIGRVQSDRLSVAVERLLREHRDAVARDRQERDRSLKTLQRLSISLTIPSILISLGVGSAILITSSRRLQASADTITNSSVEIDRSVDSQENVTHQQAQAIQQTTAAMEQLRHSSQQAAHQAQTATVEAQQVLQLARQGSEAVRQTLNGMSVLQGKVEAIATETDRLAQQARQIGSISALVSELANQTNILALNASVEAVRAGSHGKGFAVVSGEIRKLADRSKQSAAQINELVTDIYKAMDRTTLATDEGNSTVERGVGIAQHTAETFTGVADAVRNIVSNSQQISANLQEQATAIEQVVTAMDALNTSARSTVSGIDRVKARTQHLNEAAAALQNFV